MDLPDRARTLEEVNDDLRWMATLARAVGLDSLETDEAEDAISAPVGDSELSRTRGLQIREEAADALAALMRATGHQSPVIEYWAGPGAYERRVRPRLE